MVINAVYDFFASCPLFSDRCVNVNFLGHKESSVSIEPSGELAVTKKYCDGNRVFTQEFCLSTRCGFDENVGLNLKDSAFLEEVCLWIEEQNRRGIMPVLSDGFRSVAINVTKTPYLYESSVQGARMNMEFRFVYREI